MTAWTQQYGNGLLQLPVQPIDLALGGGLPSNNELNFA